MIGLALVAVGGCGGGGSAETVGDPAATPTVRAPDPGEVFGCFHHEVPVERLLDPRPATGLSASGMEALRAKDVPDMGDLRRWTIVADSPAFVSLIREIADPVAEQQGFTRTHRMIVIEDVDSVNVQGWFMTGSTSCELRRSFEGLSPATVTLDPGALPGPGDRFVRILVTERACASGKSAAGRVQAPLLDLGAETVRVALAVTQVPGDAGCPGNPATPFTLELPEPLGARPLVDAGVYPEREITAPVTSRRAGRPG